MTCDIFKVMLKYGSSCRNGYGRDSFRYVTPHGIGGALLGVDLFFLVSDRLNKRKHAR